MLVLSVHCSVFNVHLYFILYTLFRTQSTIFPSATEKTGFGLIENQGTYGMDVCKHQTCMSGVWIGF